MKKLTKVSLVISFVVVVVLALTVLPSLSLEARDEYDPFATIAKRESMKLKMEALKAELEANGNKFTVDFNPAMQYSIDQLCNFRPELEPANLPVDSSIDRISKKPVPPESSYIAAYTSVKDQGNCGSCWAFSTAGMFESVLLKEGINTDLSEQWLVSCNTDGWGCNGGWFANSYYLNPGATLESCFRYKASDLPCISCPSVYIASSTKNISKIADIQNAIKNYGAVSCAVTVTTAFQAYNSGVFDYDSTASVNHAVVLVGWDNDLGDAGCWRMKNSWGSGWGEGGLMWIEYGCSNIGYGANYLTY